MTHDPPYPSGSTYFGQAWIKYLSHVISGNSPKYQSCEMTFSRGEGQGSFESLELRGYQGVDFKTKKIDRVCLIHAKITLKLL